MKYSLTVDVPEYIGLALKEIKRVKENYSLTHNELKQIDDVEKLLKQAMAKVKNIV
jgi:septation ring formation regulator EzrA